MQQFRKYTLQTLVLSALMTTSTVGFAASESSTNTVQTITAVATTEQNIATSTQNATTTNIATQAAGVRTPILTTPKNIQDVRPYIFSDVPSDFWASRAISGVTKAELMKGYSDGTFRPNQAMTREEVATLFNNITNDGQTAFLSSKFKDITSDRWSALAIASVARKNIISGYGDNTYQPEKFMSRQEFAVVADNYIHYLGYTTEDPTVLDQIAYGDQKFVAPWAQDAVRELAYLGFTNYAPGTLFNPEKYVTRAEAAEIAYRMTQTQQALDFHNALYRQQVENKAAAIIARTFKYGDDFSQFRNDGALFWKESKLHATVVNKKLYAELQNAFTKDTDPQIDSAVVLAQGQMTQAQLEEYQSDATNLYKQLEPQGSIISIIPTDDTSALIITADTVQNSTIKDFKNKFGKKVILQLPQQEMPKTTIQFPLPLKASK